MIVTWNCFSVLCSELEYDGLGGSGGARDEPTDASSSIERAPVP